jgi:hypothetical protein
MLSNIHSLRVKFAHTFKKSSVGVAVFLRGTAASQKIRWFLGGSEEKQFYKVHILATNSRNYVLLAETCVYSFLRMQQGSTFVIHVDPGLQRYARFRFRALIKREIVEIRLIDSGSHSWQATKLELILGMCGTQELFMDADLRWNSRLPSLYGLTSYLEEFEFGAALLPKELEVFLPDSQGIRMMNLSFFTFSGVCIGFDLHEETKELQTRINELISYHSENVELIKAARMSEQIALSYILGKYSYKVNFLKVTDSRNDGSFVESCYFGATGLTF